MSTQVTTIPAPGYVYRTIGGILDIYFFPGKKSCSNHAHCSPIQTYKLPHQVPVRPRSFVSTLPSSVVPCSLPTGHSDTKYSHPLFPFSHRFIQLCRYGYKSLQDMKDRVDAVRNYQIPFDVAYADIDYMERYKDFTVGVRTLLMKSVYLVKVNFRMITGVDSEIT